MCHRTELGKSSLWNSKLRICVNARFVKKRYNMDGSARTVTCSLSVARGVLKKTLESLLLQTNEILRKRELALLKRILEVAKFKYVQ